MVEAELYLNLSEEDIEKTKKIAQKKYKSEFKDETTGRRYDLQLNTPELDFEESNEKIIVSGDTQLGFVSMQFSIDWGLLLALMSLGIKKTNKAKAVLEGLK